MKHSILTKHGFSLKNSVPLSHFIAPFLSHCQNQRRLSAATVRAYTFDMQDFQRFLALSGQEALSALQADKQLLQRYMNYLNRRCAVKTVKRRMACLRSFFDYLEYEEVISQTPFLRFRMELKEPLRPPRTMSLDEVHRLLRTVYEAMPPQLLRNLPRLLCGKQPLAVGSNEFLWLRDIAVLEILFASGLRVSELCSLTFDDVDLEQLSLTVRGKGGRERTLYLCNDDVIRVFRCYLQLRQLYCLDTRCIFVSKFRRQLSTQAVRNLILKYASEAEILHRITPHMFRHSFASLLLEEGVDIKYIQDFLGHSSISTTQIYLHTTSKKQRSILQNCHPREKLSVCASLTEDNVKLSVKKERTVI